jgi:predicted HTH transcriptional regulator
LLDYKQDIESSKPDLAKLILRIISFYNTYGGYLVFGVAETIAEEKFEVVGFDRSKLNIESIKSSIRDYANVRIQINIASFDVGTIDANQANITFIHIPQRLESEPPVHFVKDSPQTERSKFIFQKDEV